MILIKSLEGTQSCSFIGFLGKKSYTPAPPPLIPFLLTGIGLRGLK